MIGEKIVILDLGSNKIKIMVLSLDKENYISIHSKYSVHSRSGAQFHWHASASWYRQMDAGGCKNSIRSQR